jgi:PAS domain S-box-containing protein
MGEEDRSGQMVRGAVGAFDIEADLLCTADASGHFTSLNSAWERLLGFSREELLARPFIEFVHPEDVERTADEASQVHRADYEIASFENRYRTKAGGWRWLQWTARTDGETWFAIAFDVTERKAAEERLRATLTEDRLVAYSQPIIDRRRRRVVQEELLVRLRSEGADLSPGQFLPDAERFGMIDRVDLFMVAQAVRLAAHGRRAEVNLSGRTISDHTATEEIARRLRALPAQAPKIVIEITETSAIKNLDAAREFADRLAGLGCRFALDDFGTGYGSLTYLRELPVDILKIDIEFVREMTRSDADRAVVRSIVAIAHELHQETIAEGVEDHDTLRLLRRYGVDYAQGYYIGKPQPLQLQSPATATV